MKKLTQETLIKKEIKTWLKLNNWFVFYVLQGLGAYKGIVDILSIKDGIVLFIEVKTKTGRQSDNQKQFEEAITSHGGHYVIARGYEDIENYLKELKT